MPKFVVCEVNEEYLGKVKEQMKKQKMPLPKDDSQITIAHKPVATISTDELCDCKVCARIKL
ncbi:MAG: hypothetical protein HYT70_02385 [Candidatus Aenigmarchaeota archaeon]|nr:hypothetical protein [Candidatus Aenigmarchaeota archaeon]